ncbi:MAG: hypothetical protein ACLQUY_17200 [Ktedonobacterales bacterium]
MAEPTCRALNPPREPLDATPTPLESVRIIRLEPLRPGLRERLRQAQMEAARVWTLCRDRHRQARQQGNCWPRRHELQQATNGGQFALHSQTVQMIGHAFLANVKTTLERGRRPDCERASHHESERGSNAPHPRGRIITGATPAHLSPGHQYPARAGGRLPAGLEGWL